MKKNGFTLIELLAVVTIIALISIIAIPNISKNIIEKKVEIDEANQKLLSSAADVYIENNKNYDNSYEANGSTYCITIQTLIDNNYLETPFKDINGREIDYTKQVQATFQAEYNSFNYEIVDNCQELKQYVSRPNLTENMIPVTYDDEQNTWKKADKNSHWYNYQEKKWANAVLVKELKETDSSKSRDEYISAPAGTPILEQDILAYFTWIPRFRYQLFESNEETPINIVFENISTTKSTGTEKNQWLTHPAFTYNNQELSGIWVGKYETSIDNNILIKNNDPITNIDYVEANKKIIEMTNENNIYGLKNVNTHMTRNSEWGALAYLTNSIYGNNQNNTTTGNQAGIYNISGNKEFVILDNESENSLGYALSETNNWTTDNSYPTTENLYLTRGNNSIYNYQNSSVKDENTTFRITLTNNESQNQDYQRKYIVTFDPNGGTVSQTTKEVSYHEPYGSLPTPTREGYTFMGWNGKNMFDEETILMAISDVTHENGYYVFDPYKAYLIYSPNLGGIHHDSLSFTSNKKYTLSCRGYSEYVTEKSKYSYLFFAFNYSDSTTTDTSIRSKNESLVTITSKSSKTIDNISLSYGNNGANVHIRNVQLEEGDTATEYEPYYITPSTTVVQDKNHTLKAIWKANE